MYIWIFSFSPWMLHKPVATEMMHRAASPPSICLITLSVNSLQLSCKYFCWEAGCYSRRSSTQSRPSWDEPKHISYVTVYLCWEEAWPTALWHFIKQNLKRLNHEPEGTPRKREAGWLSAILCLLVEYKHLDILYSSFKKKKKLLWTEWIRYNMFSYQCEYYTNI